VYSYNSDSCHIVYGIFSPKLYSIPVLSGADLFYWFASGYGDLNHLFDLFASPYDGPIRESLVSAIVQLSYAYRIWVVLLFRNSPLSTWQRELLVVFI
jgi:hypothetical protein